MRSGSIGTAGRAAGGELRPPRKGEGKTDIAQPFWRGPAGRGEQGLVNSVATGRALIRWPADRLPGRFQFTVSRRRLPRHEQCPESHRGKSRFGAGFPLTGVPASSTINRGFPPTFGAAMIHVVCPACSKRGRVPDTAAGRIVQCSQCGGPVKVRAAAADDGPSGESDKPGPSRRLLFSLSLVAALSLAFGLACLAFAVHARSAAGSTPAVAPTTETAPVRQTNENVRPLDPVSLDRVKQLVDLLDKQHLKVCDAELTARRCEWEIQAEIDKRKSSDAVAAGMRDQAWSNANAAALRTFREKGWNALDKEQKIRALGIAQASAIIQAAADKAGESDPDVLTFLWASKKAWPPIDFAKSKRLFDERDHVLKEYVATEDRIMRSISDLSSRR